MRAAAMSVWVFINLLCFGMCGYLYLIWSQYWMYLEKQRLFDKTPPSLQKSSKSALSFQENFFTKKYNYKIDFNASSLRIDSLRKRSAVGSFWNNGKLVPKFNKSSSTQGRSSTNIVRKRQGSPRFPNIHKPILEFDSEKYACNDYTTSECVARTIEFKELLLKEFHRVLMGDSKVFKSGLDSKNPYDVKYNRKDRKESIEGAELLCALRRVTLRTVTADDEPFSRLGFRIPRDPLHQGHLFKTCAVVTSAGALLDSNFGNFIDSHDMVLRFNNAPTENYTEDVGAKTTFRVLNSQVVTKPEFKFLEEPLYKDVSILMWDPANYSSTLDEWYQHPDFPLFPVYKKFYGICGRCCRTPRHIGCGGIRRPPGSLAYGWPYTAACACASSSTSRQCALLVVATTTPLPRTPRARSAPGTPSHRRRQLLSACGTTPISTFSREAI